MQFGSWWGYRGWKGEGWLRVALFRSICTGRAITWTRWTAEAVSDGREPRGRGWTAPSTWPASYPRYSIPTVRRGEGIVDKFQIPRILEARICEKKVSRTDERIDRISTLLFPLPRSIEIGNEIFSIFGRYSGVWEASYVLKYVTRARKRAVYKIDRHVRNVKVQGSRRRGVVHGLIDKPLSFRSYRTYVVRIRSFPPPSSSQWTAIAITNATFFLSLLSPSPFFRNQLFTRVKN